MTSAPVVVASSTRHPGTSITLRPSTPVEHLGEAIAELASRLHAATYELLVLLREFDAQAGWNNGFLSCAHWLSWRTGIDPGAAREKVRVARSLADLPQLSGAMQRGEISYAKVRALTRVATPANEKQLLETAYAGTAAHVERVVRAWRRCDRVQAAHEAERQHLHRALHTWVDDDGMLVIRGRLTPELGAVVQRALDDASDALFRESAHAERVPAMADEVTPAQRRADALGRLAECALAGDLDGGTAGDRYQVVLHVEATPVVAVPAALGVDSSLEVSSPVGIEVDQATLEVQDGAETGWWYTVTGRMRRGYRPRRPARADSRSFGAGRRFHRRALVAVLGWHAVQSGSRHRRVAGRQAARGQLQPAKGFPLIFRGPRLVGQYLFHAPSTPRRRAPWGAGLAALGAPGSLCGSQRVRNSRNGGAERSNSPLMLRAPLYEATQERAAPSRPRGARAAPPERGCDRLFAFRLHLVAARQRWRPQTGERAGRRPVPASLLAVSLCPCSTTPACTNRTPGTPAREKT